MTEDEFTTISVKVESVKELENFKIHPRQPIYEVVETVINNYKKTRGKKGAES